MSFSVLGQVFGIAGKKIYYWYRNVLSNFTDALVQQALHHHDMIDRDLIDRITRCPKKVYVPIFCLENWGMNMAVDDKNISGEVYTIVTNRDTGKIALMIMTCKVRLITQVLQNVPVKIRMAVKTITKDLADNYDWLARSTLMNATRIADKFHVIVLGMEALQAVRIRYRQEILTEERKRTLEAKKEGIPRKNLPPGRKFENGDTKKELLARSRYLLFQFESEWTESQIERSRILFREFPEIKQAYDAICHFRNFYKCKIGNQRRARDSLQNWYSKMQDIEIGEIQNFVESIRRHEAQILNYFDEGRTNAFAESINSKIQKFVRSNYGVRDRDFFHFRLLLHFS